MILKRFEPSPLFTRITFLLGIWLSLFLFFTFIIPTGVQAQSRLEGFDEEPDKPWHLEADEISYDDNVHQYLARGNVTISKDDKKLTADFIRFDHRAMKAMAMGNVVMTVGNDILIGNSMEMDLDSETGTIYQGTIFLKEQNYYFKGDKLQKTGKDSYTAEKASISTCDDEPPAWKITGRNLKVTLEGYGTVTHAAIYAKRVPVMYAPYFVFPTKRKRQTGFLFPGFETSKRRGLGFNQPFFWAIGDSQDATFYLNYMDKRGVKSGGEYRYVLDNFSKGTVMFDYLNDDKIDDGVGNNSEDWGYTDDNVLRPNTDRYWFRAQANQQLPYELKARLDLDIVSDQDYLKEFKDGYSGFTRTNAFFTDVFGRGLSDYNDATRKNRLNFNRRWSEYSLNMEALWFDNVVLRRQSDIDPTLQKLPFIEFTGSRQKLFSEPFYFNFETEYVNFYRQDGQTGHRLDLHPRFFLPLRWKNYLNVEPSMSARGTLYYLDDLEDFQQDTDRFDARGLWDAKIEFFSEVFNVFKMNTMGVDRLKHSIRPKLRYSYIPDLDQDDLPSFDDKDRVGKENVLTYSLTQWFTARSFKKGDKASKEDQDDDRTQYNYAEFLRFNLENSYDINKELDNEPRPFSDVTAELDFAPHRYVTLRWDAKYNPYDKIVTENNIATTIRDPRGDRFFVEYRRTDGSNESLYFDLQVKVTDRLNLFGGYEQNILTEKRIYTSGGFSYAAQCWSANFRYIDEVTDKRFEFSIGLYGLGRIGHGLFGRVMENPFSALNESDENFNY